MRSNTALRFFNRIDEWELKNLYFPLFFFVVAVIIRLILSKLNFLYSEFEFDELSLSTALICNFVRISINKKVFPATNAQLEKSKGKWEIVFEILSLIFFALYILFITITTIYIHIIEIKILLTIIHFMTAVIAFSTFFICRFSKAIKDHLKLS